MSPPHPKTVESRVETAVRVITAILDRTQFVFNSERELQDGLAVAFSDAGLHMSREVRLSAKDRIDFVVNRIGVEVKTKGTWIDAAQQLQRYASHAEIDALLLVTTVYEHARIGTMQVLDGKPVSVHVLQGHL